jgi:hypothetical protein
MMMMMTTTTTTTTTTTAEILSAVSELQQMVGHDLSNMSSVNAVCPKGV